MEEVLKLAKEKQDKALKDSAKYFKDAEAA